MLDILWISSPWRTFFCILLTCSNLEQCAGHGDVWPRSPFQGENFFVPVAVSPSPSTSPIESCPSQGHGLPKVACIPWLMMERVEGSLLPTGGQLKSAVVLQGSLGRCYFSRITMQFFHLLNLASSLSFLPIFWELLFSNNDSACQAPQHLFLENQLKHVTL